MGLAWRGTLNCVVFVFTDPVNCRGGRGRGGEGRHVHCVGGGSPMAHTVYQCIYGVIGGGAPMWPWGQTRGGARGEGAVISCSWCSCH